MRAIKTVVRIFFALLAFLAVTFTPAFALDTLLPPGYSGQLVGANAGGGLSYLPNGDALVFTLDYVNGPAVQRIDLNGDGVPAAPEVLKQFDSSFYPSFVEVSPSGAFAVFGVTGSETSIYRIDLTTQAVVKWFDLPGNYDWAFIDDGHAYASWNPGFFDPAIPNHVSYIDLNPTTPTVADVLLVYGTPSGPIGVAANGNLFYIKGTFTYPPPAGSSRLMEFAAADVAHALAIDTPLTEFQAIRFVDLDGGFDLLVHATGTNQSEVFVSAFNQYLYRIVDGSNTAEQFMTIDDDTGPGVTYLAIYRPNERFDDSGPAGSKIAFALATDFFSTNSVGQAKPTTYDGDLDGVIDSLDLCALDNLKSAPGVCGCGAQDLDENSNGKIDCVESNDACQANEECLFEDLAPSACAGANGFLNQVNIATVVNLQATPLNVVVEYRDANGTSKGITGAVIEPNLKRDFLVNGLGLEPDSYGTVCVFTDAISNGSWSGGVAAYKPNLRFGSGGFGVYGFDYSLYTEFTNPKLGQYTQPLNTFHLGVDPQSTVANWLSISDAKPGDGKALTGKLDYYNEGGTVIRSVNVSIPDGGRIDYPGHEGIGGTENKDAVGMVRFNPDKLSDGSSQLYYIVLVRYFYDCPGASCANFRTAFVVPHRPAANGIVPSGASSSVGGQIAIVELTNFSDSPELGNIVGFGSAGSTSGTPASYTVPKLGTVHYILNREYNAQGLLETNSIGGTAVNGKLSSITVFYKLDQNGQLLHAYAAPLVGPGNVAQVSEFNSFLDQQNIGEFFNNNAQPTKVNVRILDYANTELYQGDLDLPALGSARLPFVLPKDNYGSIIVQASGSNGVIFKNLVKKDEEYVLPFLGK